MADIVISEKKKVNIFDRIIQTVVIMVNMSKMNRAIDEHLSIINKQEDENQKEYEQNILREIIFVKYQYDIMQRSMYELKMSYDEDVIQNINSTDKMERLKLQKKFLEMEYDRITKLKFKMKEDIKYYLLIISTVIETVRQNIKDEGKNKRYNNLIKIASDIDTKIQTDRYEEKDYKEIFAVIDDYVGYINDNYDIARLPVDERELIEFVIETMITGIQSDIDRHTYEFKVLVNICKNAYRYFKIVDKVFEKIITVYNESLVSKVITVKDYIRMYKEVYDLKIKTKVNDVHRLIKTEDEYLEYTKLVTNFMYDELDVFILNRALEDTCLTEVAKKVINKELNVEDEELNEEEVNINENEELTKEENSDEIIEEKTLVEKLKEKLIKTKSDVKKTVTKEKKVSIKKPKKIEKLSEVLKEAERKESLEEKKESKKLIKKLKEEMIEHAKELQEELKQDNL